MPRSRATAATGSNRMRLSAIEQLMFRFEKLSDAAAKIATSSTPLASAASMPFMLGTSTG